MLTPNDLLTATTTIPPLAADPTITAPAPNSDATGTYTPIYSMPPSPKAEPFIPAPTIPTTTGTPRDRAYTLHLQGYRSPAIAAHLHVPERTIRHWIQMTNQEINDLPALADALAPTDPDQQSTATAPDQQSTATVAAPCSPPRAGEGQGERSTLTTLHHQRTLAIERHRARSAAAWALHDQLRATLDPFLARLSERLLLHTQYPDDTDHVSMSTLALAGGPLSPAFRAMYHMLPGIINGLTRTLALAERADLQIDRLQGITPPPATQPTTTPTPAPKPSATEPVTPLPTSEDFRRAAEAERIAAEDAYIIPRLTQHQRNLIRAYCALPDPLPEGPIETWNIKIDPNAPLDRWREVLFPPTYHRGDPDDDPDDDPDNPDDDRDPTPLSGKGGNHSGKPSGNGGKPSGTPTGKRSASPRPQHRPTNRLTTAANGGGKDHHAPTRTEAGKEARTDAPTTPTNIPGNDSGNDFGNTGKKIGNPSGNITAHQQAPISPRGPFPQGKGVGG